MTAGEPDPAHPPVRREEHPPHAGGELQGGGPLPARRGADRGRWHPLDEGQPVTGGPRIAVLDYGIGNLRSAEKALQHVGADARLVDRCGVGGGGRRRRPAGRRCVRSLRAGAATTAASKARPVRPSRRAFPSSGCASGFQLLYEGSVESPGARGLGIFPGTVSPLPSGVKHPQMQWNTLDVCEDAEPAPAPLRGLGPHPWVVLRALLRSARRGGDGRGRATTGDRSPRWPPGGHCGARSSIPRNRAWSGCRCWRTSSRSPPLWWPDGLAPRHRPAGRPGRPADPG